MTEETEEMTKEERLAAIKERFVGLQENGAFARKGSKGESCPLNHLNVEIAEKVLSEHMNADGNETVVPIDLVAFAEACGMNANFLHLKDATRRYFEVVCLRNEYPELYDKIQNLSFYNTDVTTTLRSVFLPSENFRVQASKADNAAFLNIKLPSD